MAKKKKKQQGHYCRICGDYKANEKFSGKGHAQHICKSCMSAMRSGKNPEDILPEPLPVSRETTRFKKLDKEGKAVLKAFITESVTEYWQENRQIPFAESFSELKKYIIGTYDEECGILLKDDAELKTYFQTHTITTINKLLKEENPENFRGIHRKYLLQVSNDKTPATKAGASPKAPNTHSFRKRSYHHPYHRHFFPHT